MSEDTPNTEEIETMARTTRRRPPKRRDPFADALAPGSYAGPHKDRSKRRGNRKQEKERALREYGYGY